MIKARRPFVLARAAIALSFLVSAGACAPQQIVVEGAAPHPTKPGKPSKPGDAKPAEPPKPTDDPEARAKVDALIARYIEARGGADKLRALKTLRLTGKLKYGSGDSSVELGFGSAQKRPLRIRNEETFQGLTSVGAWRRAASIASRRAARRRSVIKWRRA